MASSQILKAGNGISIDLLGGTATVRMTAGMGAQLIFSTKADIDANLAYAANTMAWVIGDSTAANNGIYQKIGASGSGSWSRVGDLPYSFATAVDSGASTANALQLVTDAPVSDAQIIMVEAPYTNTATTVTAQFNGAGTVYALKTGEGSNPAIGAVVAGSILLLKIIGSDVRMVQGPQGQAGTNGADGATGPAMYTAVVPFASGIAASATAPITLVAYGGSTYYCITSHTTTASFDGPKWDVFALKGEDGTGTGDFKADGTVPMTGALAMAKIATPSPPASGNLLIYPKSDDKLYRQTSAGVEVEVGSGSGFMSIEDFGAAGDGVTDDAAAILSAVAAAAAAGLKTVYAFASEYAIGSTIVIGDGSNTAYSTINGIEILGFGAPFLRLDSVGHRLENTGTRFKWIGASGGTMVRFRGPLYGGGLRGIALNGNGLAAKPLELVSASRIALEDVTFAGFTGAGLSCDTVDTESITTVNGVQTEGLGSADITGRNLHFAVGAGAVGIDLDGYLGSAANGWDTVRVRFENTYILVNRAGGVGIRCAFTDQIVFDGLFMTGTGTSDGNEASIKLVGVATVPNGSIFPQNISIEGQCDLGQVLPIVVSGTIGGGHRLQGRTMFDQQVTVTGTAATKISGEQCESGTWPKGEFWGDFGLARHERGWARNRVPNPTFRNSPRGLTWTNPASSAPLLPGWKFTFSSSVTCEFSRQSFTPGQTDVPYEPLYFARLAISAASGNTFELLGIRIPNAEQFNGRKVTFGCWMRATSAARTVGFRVTQVFGTGGSPSATVGTDADGKTIGTSWQFVEWTITLPSTTGKIFGSNGDDYLGLYIGIPVNVVDTFDIALPYFGAGISCPAFEWPPLQAEQMESERYVRLVGAGAPGCWSSTTAATLAIVLDPPMGPDALAPTISATGSGATIITPGDGEKTATTATAAANTITNRGGTIDVGGFSAATALRPALCETSFILVSAEF